MDLHIHQVAACPVSETGTRLPGGELDLGWLAHRDKRPWGRMRQLAVTGPTRTLMTQNHEFNRFVSKGMYIQLINQIKTNQIKTTVSAKVITQWECVLGRKCPSSANKALALSRILILGLLRY